MHIASNALMKSLMLAVGLGLVLAACAKDEKPKIEIVDSSDTPQSNYSRGQAALARGDLQAAEGYFERAVAIADQEKKPFIDGWLALADLAIRTERFAAAKQHIKAARDRDPSDVEEIQIDTREVRFLTARAAGKWADDGEDVYEDAADDINESTPDAVAGALHIAGAELFMKAGDLEKAREAYTAALPTGGEARAEATAGLENLDRLARAGVSDGSVAAIAGKKQITRHDLIVLLTQETDLDREIAEIIGVRERAGELADDGGADYLDDALADDIRRVHRFGFRYPKITDGIFAGEKLVTRAEFALLLEDIIATLERDRDIKRKFIGSVSPFKDLNSSNPAFNAMMTVTSRGLFPAATDGYARPRQAVSGALAIEALRKLGQ